MCTICQVWRNDLEEVLTMHYYDFGTHDGCGYYDYGFAAPVSYGNGFSLIVVLFILLIIVGTVYFGY